MSEKRDTWWRRLDRACMATETDRRNMWRFVGWLAAWMIAFVVAMQLLRNDVVGGGAGLAAALLPSVLGVACIAAFVRYLREADELMRKIQLEALAIAFGAGALFMIGYRLLEHAGAPEADTPDALAVMAMVWALATVVGSRRYGSLEE